MMNSSIQQTILIVDDKPANLLVFDNLLSQPGRKCLHANSGREGLRHALQEQIDLIILDVQMPDMNGFEVAQVLKTNNRTKDIPVIFASAESRELSSVLKGYDEGAVDYLLKPLDAGLVKAKVNVLLKLQHQKTELLEKNATLEKCALLIENSADIIGIIDGSSGQIQEMNHAFTEILGYDVAEAIGKNLQDFAAAPLSLNDLLQDKTNEHLSFEIEMSCRDGSRKWLQWKIRIKGSQWYVNARDVTDAKEADQRISRLNSELERNVEQLKMSNKELESFSYSVSHDLRAPLRAMHGFARIMEEDYKDILDAEATRLIGNIRDNALKMGTLVDDLLEFSRLGRKELQCSETDMHRLAEFAVEECRQNGKGDAVVTIGDLPPAAVDHALMKQVWINLVSNAFKYSSQKKAPVIEIGYKPLENGTLYFVKDNGAGFDMKYAGKLFGVFQRLHSPKQFEGTGVGLAIVQRIIAKHQGTVWAEGKENEGAIFYFTIPTVATKNVLPNE